MARRRRRRNKQRGVVFDQSPAAITAHQIIPCATTASVHITTLHVGCCVFVDVTDDFDHNDYDDNCPSPLHSRPLCDDQIFY